MESCAFERKKIYKMIAGNTLRLIIKNKTNIKILIHYFYPCKRKIFFPVTVCVTVNSVKCDIVVVLLNSRLKQLI